MIQFRAPFSCLIVGASFSGKSQLAAAIILNQEKCIDKKFDKVFYCCKYEEAIPKSIRKIVTFHEGLPDGELIRNDARDNVLICCDDLFSSALQSEIISNLFISGRHINISIILIVHNLFANYRKAREITLNTSYIIIFKAVRDLSQIKVLARQVMPSHAKQFVELYIQHVRNPYSYLLLDFRQSTPDAARIRSNILSDFPEVFIFDDEIKELAKHESYSQTRGHIIEL